MRSIKKTRNFRKRNNRKTKRINRKGGGSNLPLRQRLALLKGQAVPEVFGVCPPWSSQKAFTRACRSPQYAQCTNFLNFAAGPDIKNRFCHNPDLLRHCEKGIHEEDLKRKGWKLNGIKLQTNRWCNEVNKPTAAMRAATAAAVNASIRNERTRTANLQQSLNNIRRKAYLRREAQRRAQETQSLVDFQGPDSDNELGTPQVRTGFMSKFGNTVTKLKSKAKSKIKGIPKRSRNRSRTQSQNRTTTTPLPMDPYIQRSRRFNNAINNINFNNFI